MLFRRLLLFAVLVGLSQLATARPSIVFSCSVPESLPQWQMIADVYTEAFDNLGYSFSMVYVNLKREHLVHKNSDNFDGSCSRGKTFSELTNNAGLLLVNTPIGHPGTSIWTRRDHRNRHLSSASYIPKGSRVGYLRGSQSNLSDLETYSDIESVSFLKPNLGMKSLAGGRIDYWLGFSFTGNYLIDHLDIEDSVVKVANLRRNYLYPFLHVKHQLLVPKLERELTRIIERNGSLIE